MGFHFHIRIFPSNLDMESEFLLKSESKLIFFHSLNLLNSLCRSFERIFYLLLNNSAILQVSLQ